MFRWTLVSFLAIAALGGAVSAGTLHPSVSDQLPLLEDGETLSVIAFLSDRADIPTLNTELRARHATRAERHQEVVLALQNSADRSQGSLQDRLTALRDEGAVVGFTPYWITNAIVFNGTPEAIQEVAARADVGVVILNFSVTLIDPVRDHVAVTEGDATQSRLVGATPGMRAINAPRVWNELGITGAGRLVANLDTGVDGNHPALSSRWRGNNGAPWTEAWLDVLGTGTQSPTDTHGHGTHVMGTITGLGVATADSIGVAWGAQWIACNAINQGVGTGFDNDVYDAYEWFADPDGDPLTSDDVPDVVQNSWGVFEGLGYPDCATIWWDAIDNAEAAGLVSTWSAGNEGSGSQSMRSPADRIDSPLNTFSVGAIDATNFNFPFPIAGFSSRGPSGCDGVTIKPEVVAPGVDVYSSTVGGGYGQNGWSGTSMAGPHVAGIVALMREANPDIDVESVKQILLDTAIDLGTAGEENTYGMGLVDAYEAVIMAAGGGTITGFVAHADLGVPVAGANIEVVEAGRNFTTNPLGEYAGLVQQGIYTVRASHPAFQIGTAAGVGVNESQITTLDFDLVPSQFDVTAPVVGSVEQVCATDDVNGPYPVRATITDDLGFVVADLYYAVDGGTFTQLGMLPTGGNVYASAIPGQPLGSTVSFYIAARDAIGNETLDPPGAPNNTRTTLITSAVPVFTDDVETDLGWQLGVPGDNATTGMWERAEPQATFQDGTIPAQTGEDHTSTGTMCFVTGPLAGSSVGDYDVDDGCTTLLSPVFDLAGVLEARIGYWRWWYDGTQNNDEFVVDISNDGGATWVPLERLTASVNQWTQAGINLCALITPTDTMQIRVVACDEPNNSIVEVAIDDIVFEVFGDAVDVAGNTVPIAPATGLDAISPNPFNPQTRIGYRLATQTSVSLKVYDLTGREVTTLVEGVQAPGRYSFAWDGTNRDGVRLSSGVYFVRLTAEGQVFDQRVTLLK